MTQHPVTPGHVCLVGLRCAGKSTVGRLLARELGWPFADLDESLAELWGRPRRGSVGRYDTRVMTTLKSSPTHLAPKPSRALGFLILGLGALTGFLSACRSGPPELAAGGEIRNLLSETALEVRAALR